MAVIATLSKGYGLDYVWKQVDQSPAKDAAGYDIRASESGGEPPGSVASGSVIAQRYRRHRQQEFLRFLKLIDSAVPKDLDLHLVLDNYATHETPAIREWLVRHPRFRLHFTPASSSWLNLVERWFAELATRKLRRSAHRSVTELEAGIRTWINEWNKNPRPFTWIDGDPKSRAGTRTVSFPADIVPELADHLERFAEPEPDVCAFIGPKGGRLRRSSFREVRHRARGAVGLPELHFHDLRHTGNTMAAAQGASLKELMERMGHSSPRAALIYLHATRERDQKIAAGMGKIFTDAKKASTSKPATAPKRSGTTPRTRLTAATRKVAKNKPYLGWNDKSG